MSAGASNTGAADRAGKLPEVPKEQPPIARAVAPLASVSSAVDPKPSYIMAGACAGGAGWAYKRLNNPRAAAVAGLFSASYLFAGRLLVQGHERLGYDVGTVTSLGLLGAAGPTAWATGEAYSVAMATLGGMSTVANLVKSVQFRTGKPLEPPTRAKGGERVAEAH